MSIFHFLLDLATFSGQPQILRIPEKSGFRHGFYNRFLFTMRTHVVNQAFRFVEGTWLHRKGRQIRFVSEMLYFTSYVRKMF